LRLKITHRTEYRYDEPVSYALQRVRLVPQSGPTQTVTAWTLEVTGAREEVRFFDHFATETRLVSVEGGSDLIAIEARGEVETRDTAGVTGAHRGFAPLWFFQHATPLTAPGEAIRELADSARADDDIARLHRLMDSISARVAYVPGATDSATKAEAALLAGRGVCQDHAHVFVAAARLLGFPARYVSGYLRMEQVEQTASHAWAEAHVPALGWVAFDAANGISPDENYVRIATGRDYRDAMPISGIRRGAGEEHLAVRLTVEQ
jgi:transglutaminase-like putative cysteine protease